jgi:predicted alpha-1,2-mannosidase
MKQLFFVIPLALFFSCKKSEKSPVDFVNPHIGTISHLLTTPSAKAYLPHSMMQIAPITVNGINDRFLAQRIYGFPVGNASFMPVSGKYASTADSCSGSFDRDFEIVTPYFISEQLDDYNANVEATIQSQSAWFRVKWGNEKDNFLVIFLPGEAEIVLTDSFNLNGCNSFQGTKKYFHLNFSASFSVERIYSDSASTGNRIFGKDKTLVLKFKQPEISIKTGISFIDIAQAQQNLKREMADKQFEDVVQSAKNTWNEVLGKIEITSLTNDQKAIFYTAMYRTLNSMWNITEDGRCFSIFDKKVHSSGGRDFYTGDGLWDSYRVKHPLQLILNPQQQEDMLESYARMYKQYGTMPVFPFPQGELTFMLGNHLAIFAADTWNKGYQNFDLKTVYEGLKKNALECTMLPDVNAPKTLLDDFYQVNGYFPALRETDAETEPVVSKFYRRQAVAVTLENSTDDYCIAQLADELGLKDDQALFAKRAANFKNVFNPATRFMSPKMADGKWVPGFDPMSGGRQAGRDYFAECNAWVYTFHVQHDVDGLISLFGSREAFTAKLDSLFQMQFPGYKFDFQKQFPDMTGLTGMHSQGNEPAFHIPYLYCYAGEPWKTQKIVRQIMDAWYFNHPMGLCGDDDDGALSAWYVFSAMGFYPVSPGMPYYVIGSPLFPETVLHLANGKEFRIVAKNVSKQNKYIQKSTLQNKNWDKPWFSHSDMMKGGILELEMGPKPNKNWGASPSAAPPSMSKIYTTYQIPDTIKH